jgi:glycosyltransferase involved in cell wall biosynthesis
LPCIENLPSDVSLTIIGPNRKILKSCFNNSSVFKKSNFRFEYKYWKLKTVYKEILKCDVGIIPWQEINTFQKLKSINRLVLFMSLCMPVIASPIPSYLKIVKDKENGFIAKKESEWTENIEFLRDNPKERKLIGEIARKAVIDKYSIEAKGALYINIFKQILKSNLRN